MIEGTLSIILDPPTLGFASDRFSILKHCSRDDVYTMLTELGVENKNLREYFARLRGNFSSDMLSRFGLQ